MTKRTPQTESDAGSSRPPRRAARPARAVFAALLGGVAGLGAGAYWHEALGEALRRAGVAAFDRPATGVSGRTAAPAAEAEAHGEAEGHWEAEAHGKAEAHREAEAQSELAAQLWTCGMHPQVIQREPGTCPICHMKLEPLDVVARGGSQMSGAGPTGAGAGDAGRPAVTIDPVVVQNMGVRVAPVERGPVRRTIRAVGYLTAAQPRVYDINLRVAGWIEALHANTTGQAVAVGDPLFDLYSPDVQVALRELLIAAAPGPSTASGRERFAEDASLLSDARRKLEQYGLTPAQIDQLARERRVPRTVTFLSPYAGDLVEKNVVAGAGVQAGERIMRIVDHSVLWLDAQVYEQDLALVRLGQPVQATIASMPGQTFAGEAIFIHPQVDPLTRTATVRMELPNPDRVLRPGMYATARLSAQLADDALLVPREAVIDTGTRQVVFIAAGGGRFEPREVVLGPASEAGAVQVISGLTGVETVVTSGQFLLDAESRIQEAIAKHMSHGLLAGSEPGDALRSAGSGERAAAPREPMPWSPEVDRLFAAYLEIARQLGAADRGEAPVDAGGVRAAAEALAERRAGASGVLPQRVVEAASALAGVPLDEQRRRFVQLSTAMIALADVCPPSRAVGDALYVAHCPMAFSDAGADWLQDEAEIANPYYATQMKRCGLISRTIATTEGQE